MLQDYGINAVLNVQTVEEQNSRGINSNRLKHFYRNHGINKVVNCPIDDNDDTISYEQFFHASLKLNEMIQDEQ